MFQYNNETVSIITPVYNASSFIDQTLSSVLRQSYKDYEVILVDDCSNDNSAEIIAKYTEKYPNIIYYKQETNQGAAVARNKALEMAKGRYVAFLDSDDVWCEDKLAKQLAFLKKKNCAITCTALDCIDEEDKPLNSIRNVCDVISYQLLLHNTMIATSTVLIDRNKSGNFCMPLRRGGQDYATWLMLMRSGENCYGLNEVLCHYRVLKHSLSSNKLNSIRQVWEIQTQNENINKLSAAINVCFFMFNGFIKHFLR